MIAWRNFQLRVKYTLQHHHHSIRTICQRQTLFSLCIVNFGPLIIISFVALNFIIDIFFAVVVVVSHFLCRFKCTHIHGNRIGVCNDSKLEQIHFFCFKLPLWRTESTKYSTNLINFGSTQKRVVDTLKLTKQKKKTISFCIELINGMRKKCFKMWNGIEQTYEQREQNQFEMNEMWLKFVKYLCCKNAIIVGKHTKLVALYRCYFGVQFDIFFSFYFCEIYFGAF